MYSTQFLFCISYLIFITNINCSYDSDELFQVLTDKRYGDECANTIYRGCLHARQYSDEELETVRKYLQHLYTTEAAYKPLKPPCKKLYVRKDFKCMAHKERMELLRVLRELYRKGVPEYFANLHSNWWPIGHKTAEQGQWHQWLELQYEKKMKEINPNIALPYWAPIIDFAQPERSILWDYFGTSGNYSTAYCLKDGYMTNLNLVRCVRRQWEPDYTMTPWYSPELETYLLQTSNTSEEYAFLNLGFHFIPHLSLGGWNGDHSVKSAPYDFPFYMWHAKNDMLRLQWRLQNTTARLTPPDYNTGIRANPKTGKIERSNIYDPMSYWKSTSVLETFQFYFGDLCYIYEEMIEPIYRVATGKPQHIPSAVKRLRKALPERLFKKYFPKFAENKFGFYYHSLPEVGDCNRQCRPMPMFERFLDNENGRRQLVDLNYDLGLKNGPRILKEQDKFEEMIYDLNKHGYCSPYIACDRNQY